MTIRTVLSSLLLVAFTACVGPTVVPTRSADGFTLASLRQHRVAVWPIPTAKLDESATRTVADEYGTTDRFLDSLGDQLSERVVALCQRPSMRSREVVAALTSAEATRAFLDPDRALGTADPGNRFASSPGPDLALLTAVPDLAGVRYAVLFRDLEMGRQVTAGTASTFVPDSKGGMTWAGGSAGSASTRARLRVAVLDLPARSVVWEGSVFSDASSLLFLGAALHEVELDLVQNFLVEMGAKQPVPHRRSP
jgi:hypothetical protein